MFLFYSTNSYAQEMAKISSENSKYLYILQAVISIRYDD